MFILNNLIFNYSWATLFPAYSPSISPLKENHLKKCIEWLPAFPASCLTDYNEALLAVHIGSKFSDNKALDLSCVVVEGGEWH